MPPLRRQLLILIVACLVTRLPQLWSPDLLLDGDEAVLALMAKHLAAGQSFPIFFYGQTYGFALLEAAAGAAMFTLCGPQAWALKLAMLALWSTGIACYFLALRELVPHSRRWPFVIALLLVTSPAWAVWSMKARGGYLTAFLLSSLITWLVLHRDWHRRGRVQLLAGFLTVMVAEAQILWLPGLIPLVAYAWYRAGRRVLLIAYAVGALGACGLFSALRAWTTFDFWPHPHLQWQTHYGAALLATPLRIYQHFGGAYYLHHVLDAPLAARMFAAGATLVVLLSMGYWGSVVRVCERRGLMLALGVSLLTAIAPTMTLNHYAPRYLLPLSGACLMLLCVFCAKTRNSRGPAVGVIAFILIGAVSQVQFRHFQFQPGGEPAIRALIDRLERAQISAVFSHDPLLQWQVMFYSNERIAARFLFRDDRYAPYVQRVNTALNDGGRVAEIAPLNVFANDDLAAGRVWTIAGEYGIFPNTTRARLERLGFQF